MIQLYLEPYEYVRGREIGLERAERRRLYGHRQNYRDAWHSSTRAQYMLSVEDANVAACLTELAVAKHLGVYWHGHGGHHDPDKRYYKDADVGDRHEVRHVVGTANNLSHFAIYESDIEHRRPTDTIWAGHVPTEHAGRLVYLFGWMYRVDAWRIAEECHLCRVYDDHRSVCLTHLNTHKENNP